MDYPKFTAFCGSRKSIGDCRMIVCPKQQGFGVEHKLGLQKFIIVMDALKVLNFEAVTRLIGKVPLQMQNKFRSGLAKLNFPTADAFQAHINKYIATEWDPIVSVPQDQLMFAFARDIDFTVSRWVLDARPFPEVLDSPKALWSRLARARYMVLALTELIDQVTEVQRKAAAWFSMHQGRLEMMWDWMAEGFLEDLLMIERVANGELGPEELKLYQDEFAIIDSWMGRKTSMRTSRMTGMLSNVFTKERLERIDSKKGKQAKIAQAKVRSKSPVKPSGFGEAVGKKLGVSVAPSKLVSTANVKFKKVPDVRDDDDGDFGGRKEPPAPPQMRVPSAHEFRPTISTSNPVIGPAFPGPKAMAQETMAEKPDVTQDEAIAQAMQEDEFVQNDGGLNVGDIKVQGFSVNNSKQTGNMASQDGSDLRKRDPSGMDEELITHEIFVGGHGAQTTNEFVDKLRKLGATANYSKARDTVRVGFKTYGHEAKLITDLINKFQEATPYKLRSTMPFSQGDRGLLYQKLHLYDKLNEQLVSTFGETNIGKIIAAQMADFDWEVVTARSVSDAVAKTNYPIALGQALDKLVSLQRGGFLTRDYVVRSGRYYQANEVPKIVSKQEQFYGVETNHGVFPATTDIPPNVVANYIAEKHSGIPKSFAISKPGAQFQQLVSDATQMLDSNLYKARENALNYKVDIVSEALNMLKQQYKDNFNGRIGSTRGDIYIGAQHRGSFFPLSGLLNNATDFVPTSVKIAAPRGWKSGKGFGVYYSYVTLEGDDRIPTMHCMPVMQFSSAAKRFYSFQAAPYFGYADSIFSLLKDVNVLGEKDFTGAIAQPATGVHGMAIAAENIKYTRGTTEPQVNTRFSASLMALKQFEDFRKSAGSTANIKEMYSKAIQSLKAIQSFRFPYISAADFNARPTAFYKSESLAAAYNPTFAIGGIADLGDLQKVPVEYMKVPIGTALPAQGRIENVANLPTRLYGTGARGGQAGQGGYSFVRAILYPSTLNWDFVYVPHQGGVPQTTIYESFTGKFATSLLKGLQAFVSLQKTNLAHLLALFKLIVKKTGSSVQLLKELEKLEEVMTVPTVRENLPNYAELVREVIDILEARMTSSNGWAALTEGEALTFSARPVKINTGGLGNNLVIDALGAKTVLEQKLDTIAEGLSSSGGQIWGPDSVRGRFSIYIPPDAIDAGQTVTLKVTIDGFQNNSKTAIKYLQTLMWIRNFNYGNKLERQKISKNRVNTYLDTDKRQLKKLIYTFGGEPAKFMGNR